MQDTTAAYWAGYLDGEGCYRIVDGLPRIEVITTHKKTLEVLQLIAGGKIYGGKRSIGSRNWRPQFRWQISGQVAVEFMKWIRRFSIEKLPQIDLILSYWEGGVDDEDAVRQLRNLKLERSA